MDSLFPNIPGAAPKHDGACGCCVETILVSPLKIIRFTKERCYGKNKAYTEPELLIAHLGPVVNGVAVEGVKELSVIVEPALVEKLQNTSYTKLYITWKYTSHPIVYRKLESWIPFLTKFE